MKDKIGGGARGLRFTATGAALLCAIAMIAACGSSGTSNGTTTSSSSLPGITNGTITVAIPINPPDSSLQPSGAPSGYDPLLEQMILKALGAKHVHFVVGTYGNMVPGLVAHRWAVATALDITSQRCQSVIFSAPDIVGYDGFAVKAGNPLHILSIKDIAAKHAKVGVLTGSYEITYMEAHGVSSANVVEESSDASEIADLETGRVNVIMETSLAFAQSPSWVQANHGLFAIIRQVPDFPPSISGFAFSNNELKLRNAFDVELAKLRSEGALPKLAAQSHNAGINTGPGPASAIPSDCH